MKKPGQKSGVLCEVNPAQPKTALQVPSTLTMRGLRLRDPEFLTEPERPSRTLAVAATLRPCHHPVVTADAFCTSVRPSWSTFCTSRKRSLAAGDPRKQQDARCKEQKELPSPVAQEQAPASWIRGSPGDRAPPLHA